MTKIRQQHVKNLLLLWPFVTAEKKIKIFLYSSLTVLSALTELVSVGALGPFIVVFIQPEKLLEYDAAAVIAQYLGLQSTADLQLFLFLSFSCAILVSGVIKLLLAWFQARLSYAIAADLASQIFTSAIHRNYAYHLSVNSDEIISSIVNKANIVADNLINPALSFLLAIVNILAFGVFLVALDPIMTIMVFGFIGTTYFIIAARTQSTVATASKKINLTFDSVMRIVREALDGIRYVMLTGTQTIFIDAHAEEEKALRTAQADVSFASLFPRAVIESTALIVLASVVYFVGNSRNEANDNVVLLALLGVMAMAAQKLLPVAQQAYAGWTKLSGAAAIIEDTLQYLHDYTAPRRHAPEDNDDARLKFDNKIELSGVTFRYGDGKQPTILDNVDLELARGSKIGITGPSGSGKSTLIDLIMAFLDPEKGNLFIDGVRLDNEEKRKKWHANIALVPQDIYLSDSSILTNIAFGVPVASIDLDTISEVIKITRLEEFVASLDQGYDYRVGQNGKNLSNGQRQRIGIARALYRQADLLIIDEGTSALDTRTQAEVVNNISSLKNSPAIIMVAHRTEILADYDVIYEVKGGRVMSVEN